jgi:hypothetical protein
MYSWLSGALTTWAWLNEHGSAYCYWWWSTSSVLTLLDLIFVCAFLSEDSDLANWMTVSFVHRNATIHSLLLYSCPEYVSHSHSYSNLGAHQHLVYLCSFLSTSVVFKLPFEHHLTIFTIYRLNNRASLRGLNACKTSTSGRECDSIALPQIQPRHRRRSLSHPSGEPVHMKPASDLYFVKTDHDDSHTH